MASCALLEVYRGRTVLLTGDSGFKGSWLSIWLSALGARVVGYSLEPPSHPSNFHASLLEKRITHVHGDIRDGERVSAIFDIYCPDMVIHMAAQAIVTVSYQEPGRTFDTNVGGTVNLLEAVRSHPEVRVFINVTSDKCYENREWIWGYRENDPLGGHDPYSASKACAELVFSSYLRSFFSRGGQAPGMATVRAGNVIGGGDWAKDRLIPDSMRALEAGRPVPVRNPGLVRPWQHVLEPLSGYLALGARLWSDPERYSGAWNFGPGGSDGDVTVRDIVEAAIGLWGSGSWQDLSRADAPHETSALRLCCEKALRLLGWHAFLSIRESLAMTVDWYRRFSEGKGDMHGFCVDQIGSYCRKAGELGLPWAV
jgi:CDP-glucose 4,6-dehydratase